MVRWLPCERRCGHVRWMTKPTCFLEAIIMPLFKTCHNCPHSLCFIPHDSGCVVFGIGPHMITLSLVLIPWPLCCTSSTLICPPRLIHYLTLVHLAGPMSASLIGTDGANHALGGGCIRSWFLNCALGR